LGLVADAGPLKEVRCGLRMRVNSEKATLQ